MREKEIHSMRKTYLLYVLMLCFPLYLFSQGAGYALHFVDHDKVDIPSNLKGLNVTDAFTIDAWLNTDSWSSLRMFFQDGATFDVCAFYLAVTPHHNELLVCLHTSDGRFYDDHITCPDFENHKWCAISYSYDGSAITIHLNGVRIFQQAWTGEIIDGNMELRISYRENSWEKPYVGFVDELRIWNICLTTDQIREYMHMRLDYDKDGIVGYWSFDEGEGTVAGDSSASGNDAVLDGPDWVLSTAPLGAGMSQTVIVDAAGAVTFDDALLDMDFTEKTETDTFVVTAIESEPGGVRPGGADGVAPRYWIVRKYGQGTFSADMAFTVNGGAIQPEDINNPDNLKLYHRDFYSDGEWTLAGSATAVTDGSVTFSGVTEAGQYFICRAADSPVVSEGYRHQNTCSLRQNRPNPFNPFTVITYTISELEFVTLKVYDTRGREIATLVETSQDAGTYSVSFNAGRLPGGLYLYRIEAGEFIETHKMVVMK
jgi:hypothetical protein